MSQENVERLKTIYAEPVRNVSAVLELCDPEIEVAEPPEIPDASSFHGYQGVRDVLSKLEEVFPDMEFAANEFIARGDRVLVCMQWRGTGAGSGASGNTTLFHLWTFKGDRAIRIDAFLDRRAALEAASLKE